MHENLSIFYTFKVEEHTIKQEEAIDPQWYLSLLIGHKRTRQIPQHFQYVIERNLSITVWVVHFENNWEKQ